MSEPFWAEEPVTLHLGDCLDVLKDIPADSIDAVVTDPPYGLTEMSLTQVLQAIAAWITGDRTHVPAGKGFMGREWDKFVPPPGVWDECLRVLKPGGHLLAFAGTRTFDLMTLSIRIAGFEIRDTIADLTGQDAPGLIWAYGQGMPKSLNVSKAIDRAAGAQREVLAEGGPLKRMIPGADQNRTGSWIKDNGRTFVPTVTAPATEDAARWEGWGTALKPAWEPIVVARKPLAGTVAANVLEHGTGAINIAATSVEAAQRPLRVSHGEDTPGKTTYGSSGPGGGSHAAGTTDEGRWPANLVLAHAPSCTPVGVREVPGDGRAGQEPGTRPGGFGDVGATKGDGRPNGPLHGPQIVPVWDCAPGCPVAELDRQSGNRKAGSPLRGTEPSARLGANGIYGAAGSSRPEFAGYADEGGASRFFPVFKYEPKAPASERPRLEDGTSWPTVKPVDLMRWLVRLVTPPGGTVLDLFAGTGTTAEACIVEGFPCVLIDKDPVAAALIRERLRKPIQPDLFGGAA